MLPPLFRLSEYPVTLDEVVGKIRELRKRVRLLCLPAGALLVGHIFDGYSPDVAAHQRPGLVTRRVTQRRSNHNSLRLTPTNLCYGGCAWDALGRAGFLDSRFTNLRIAATLSLGNESGSSLCQGVRQCTAQIRINSAFPFNVIPRRVIPLR